MNVAERRTPKPVMLLGRRDQIVAESIGNIDGRMELREVNMAFNARYTSGAQGPDRVGCGEAKV